MKTKIFAKMLLKAKKQEGKGCNAHAPMTCNLRKHGANTNVDIGVKIYRYPLYRGHKVLQM